MLFGAPYAVTSENRINIMLDMLQLTKKDKLVDLGSGDGRIVIAAAKRGIKSYGYEMNPILVLISRNNIRKQKLENRAKIYWKSYWNISLKDYSVITVFGIKHIMPSLKKKLEKELRGGERIVSNHFKFPKWKEVKKRDNLYLYRMPIQDWD